MLCQGQVSTVTLHFVSGEDARQRPEQSAASAIRIAVTDFVHSHVQLETVIGYVASSRVRESETMM